LSACRSCFFAGDVPILYFSFEIGATLFVQKNGGIKRQYQGKGKQEYFIQAGMIVSPIETRWMAPTKKDAFEAF